MRRPINNSVEARDLRRRIPGTQARDVTIMGKLLEQSLREAPVIKKDDYDYVVHPIADGVPFLSTELLREVTEELVALADTDVDYIITAEAMGIPLATAMSLRTNIPFTIIRKRGYGLPGERELKQQTAYSRSSMFINGLVKGDRVLIVDDLLSTGGTLRAILEALRTMGVMVKDVMVVIEKKHAKETKKLLETEFGIAIRSLIIY